MAADGGKVPAFEVVEGKEGAFVGREQIEGGRVLGGGGAGGGIGSGVGGFGGGSVG
jgi:hypothetical protein